MTKPSRPAFTLIEVQNINGGTELIRADLIESIGLPMEKRNVEEFWMGWVRLTTGKIVAFGTTDGAANFIEELKRRGLI